MTYIGPGSFNLSNLSEYLPTSFNEFFGINSAPNTTKAEAINNTEKPEPTPIESAYSLEKFKQYCEEVGIPFEQVKSALLTGIPLTAIAVTLYQYNWPGSICGILNSSENAALKKKTYEITTFAIQGLTKEFTQLVKLLKTTIQSGTLIARNKAIESLYKKIVTAAIAAQSSPGDPDSYKGVLLDIIDTLGAAVGWDNIWYQDLANSINLAFILAAEGTSADEIYEEMEPDLI